MLPHTAPVERVTDGLTATVSAMADGCSGESLASMPNLVSQSVGRRRPIVSATEPSGFSVRVPNVEPLEFCARAGLANTAASAMAAENPAAVAYRMPIHPIARSCPGDSGEVLKFLRQAARCG